MEKVITPECVVKFPTNEDGKISFGLSFNPKGNEKFVETMNQLQSQVPNVNTEFFKKDKSKDESGVAKENGNLIFTVTTKEEYGIKAFTVEGYPVEGEIGWGSRVKASITLKPFDYKGKKGLSKYLNGFQVIEQKGGTISARSLGFETANDFTETEEYLPTTEDTDSIPF
jgi:hypothetical protein